MDFLYTIFHFIVAIGILVSIHEFGHFWVARKVGVKVLRFSIGFGKVICSYQKSPQSTEYVLSAIPLGGYVKMVDEREGEVEAEDIPFAFNRQSLLARSAIVAAGPIFNLLLAIILFWSVFMMGEMGLKPIVGSIEAGTLAAEAGFKEGEEIITVNDEEAPTWTEAMTLLFASAVQGQQEIKIVVKNLDEDEKIHFLAISAGDALEPEKLYEKIGLKPWTPLLKPIIGTLLDEGAAKQAGLQTGDIIVSADGVEIKEWIQWVEYVQARPEVTIQLLIERDDVHLPLSLTPAKVEKETKDIGRIGAGVHVPADVIDSLRVEYSLPPLEALIAAVEKTWFYSVSTVQMMGKMVIGKASSQNISGPISIAKYAGQSAEMGLIPFLKFLAAVSIALGVLNLLPVPVLDGGHLLFFAIEAIKGSPMPDKVQIYFQNFGMLMLMSLMVFAIFLDIGRLF